LIILLFSVVCNSLQSITALKYTPIEHIIVIFQENISFDHYFATYPYAKNSPGEPYFSAFPNTSSVNNLLSAALLTDNPNSANPYRLNRAQVITCDMNHTYTAEQKAYNGGLMDKFVQFTGSTSTGCDPIQVMAYFDGNTVTALWNYAQRFAMNDNSYSSTFGPSTPGALNLISGQTHGSTIANIEGQVVNGTVIEDPFPVYDDCSSGRTIAMKGKNIGDLLNSKGVSWGWFHGGFKPSNRTANGSAVCNATHINIANKSVVDYSAAIEPFQYYKSTANPHHLPPTSTKMIGHTDQANHQYDLQDFWDATEIGNMPAVSFLKPAAYQDGHAGYSDPLDEQTFLVETINRLQKLQEWNSTVVIIAYDDSGGWYDHVMPPIVSQSNDPKHDALAGGALCGHVDSTKYKNRCGYGPRQPLIIISPWTKVNFVDHSITDQSSILKFIEDRWSLGSIGDDSFDSRAGTIENMLDFQSGPHSDLLILNSTTGNRPVTIINFE
jgi:phospholipase C